MLNKLIITMALLGLTVPLTADEIQVSPDNPGTYTVVKGDTLWDIAGQFLEEPWRWPEIWNVNPQIENPHLIYPGDVISLSYQEGEPVLTVDRPEGDTAAVPVGSRTVKLSPVIREEDGGEAIPSIPIDVIRNFLTHPLVMQDADLAAMPYVLSSYDQHLVAGPGNRIYVRGLSNASDRQKFSIYRKGPEYRSGDRLLGYEAIYVGEAVLDVLGDPSTLVVTQARREVLEGDRIIAVSEQDIQTDIIPHEPSNQVNASVISATDVLTEIGQYQVVVIDAGAAQGVDVGSVLGIYQTGAQVQDRSLGQHSAKFKVDSGLLDWLGRPNAKGESVQLPTEYAGVLLVFRTFDQVSYGLIMEAISAVHLQDAVRNL